jgi:hypothetical protein
MNKMTMAACAVLLSACGGGGDGGGQTPVPTADPLFDDYRAEVGGGFKEVIQAVNKEFPTSSSGCDFVDASQATRANVEKQVHDGGGTVTVSTATKWCGSTNAEANCLTRLGNIFALENIDKINSKHFTDVYITGVSSGNIAHASFLESNSGNGGFMAVEQRDSAVTASSTSTQCNQGKPFRAIDDIAGDWPDGRRAEYNPSGQQITTSLAALSCVGHVCEIPGVASNIHFDGFDSADGAWQTTADGAYVAATMSHDGQSLAVVLCENQPRTQDNTALYFSKCHFLSFAR